MMPILNALQEFEWVDPDDVPRPIVAFGAEMSDVGGFELDLHRHRKGQMLLVERGALSCEVEGGLWIVPPRSAIWIPGGALHAIKATGALEGYNAFVGPDVDTHLPMACCAVSVTPLLRELLTRAAHLPYLYEEGGANSRLVAVLLDELAVAQVEDLHLPMPTDPRLRRIVDEMMACPANRGSLKSWARHARHERAHAVTADQSRDGNEFRSLASAAQCRTGGQMAGRRRLDPTGYQRLGI